ncbi:MAG: hypothetical protein J6A25_03385 [Lachnospiraceae bacterium]|nr:hypothetical protein [Lachnospiraceae bacterium]
MKENEVKFLDFKFMVFCYSLMELCGKCGFPDEFIDVISNYVNSIRYEVDQKYPSVEAARANGEETMEEVVNDIVINALTRKVH